MATNLYQEAIAEAKQLKEMAEQSAKNKIIEAITPQIRSLVESRLLGELDDMDSDSDDLEVGSMMDDDEEDDVEVEMGSSDDSLGDSAISVSSISSPDRQSGRGGHGHRMSSTLSMSTSPSGSAPGMTMPSE